MVASWPVSSADLERARAVGLWPRPGDRNAPSFFNPLGEAIDGLGNPGFDDFLGIVQGLQQGTCFSATFPRSGEAGRFQWVIKSFKILGEPIPAVGRRGLFEKDPQGHQDHDHNTSNFNPG
jgi:hypothetical protein